MGISGGEEEGRGGKTCWANVTVDTPVVEPAPGSVIILFLYNEQQNFLFLFIKLT